MHFNSATYRTIRALQVHPGLQPKDLPAVKQAKRVPWQYRRATAYVIQDLKLKGLIQEDFMYLQFSTKPEVYGVPVYFATKLGIYEANQAEARARRKQGNAIKISAENAREMGITVYDSEVVLV